MTDLLKQAIDSGQVSAEQIEAHREAGELPIEMYEPMEWVLVPTQPTPEIMAAAAIAAWPTASQSDIELARKAAPLVLMKMEASDGVTVDMLAAIIATMAPAYRAMISAAPEPPHVGTMKEDAVQAG